MPFKFDIALSYPKHTNMRMILMLLIWFSIQSNLNINDNDDNDKSYSDCKETSLKQTTISLDNTSAHGPTFSIQFNICWKITAGEN